MKKDINVTKMNKLAANGKNLPWVRHTCKESALAGRVKKLAPKVNAIVKEMELDPDKVTVEFENVKPVGGAMFDTIHLKGEGFTLDVEFHTASKATPGYVAMDIDCPETGKEDHIECETWKELKAMLSEYTSFLPADAEPEAAEEDEIEEAPEVAEEDEVEEASEEEEDEVEDPENDED